MKEYEGIDVPDFMKHYKEIKKEQIKIAKQEELDKAYIKGGICGVLATFTIISVMVLISIIEII